jgi:DivIVA domain-containing protein
MYWLQLVVIVALLAAVGWLAIGGGGHMSEPMPDRPDLALPDEGMLARNDVDRVRFSVGARGYRMDEVDDVLDRLAHEIELREDRIAELEGRPRRPASESAAVTRSGESESGSRTVSEFETVSESENVSESETTPDAESAPESKTEANGAATSPVQQGSENEGTAE